MSLKLLYSWLEPSSDWFVKDSSPQTNRDHCLKLKQMYFKIHNSRPTKILFHALPLQSKNQRYNLIRPIQIIPTSVKPISEYWRKTIITLANPRNTIKWSFAHALRLNYHSLKLLLLESSLKSSLSNRFSINAIERAYIYIDKCHLITNRLENAGLNSNSQGKTLRSNAPESKRFFHSIRNRSITSSYSVMH